MLQTYYSISDDILSTEILNNNSFINSDILDNFIFTNIHCVLKQLDNGDILHVLTVPIGSVDSTGKYFHKIDCPVTIQTYNLFSVQSIDFLLESGLNATDLIPISIKYGNNTILKKLINNGAEIQSDSRYILELLDESHNDSYKSFLTYFVSYMPFYAIIDTFTETKSTTKIIHCDKIYYTDKIYFSDAKHVFSVGSGKIFCEIYLPMDNFMIDCYSEYSNHLKHPKRNFIFETNTVILENYYNLDDRRIIPILKKKGVVFSGYGGSLVAKYCCKFNISVLFQHIAKNYLKNNDTIIKRYFNIATKRGSINIIRYLIETIGWNNPIDINHSAHIAIIAARYGHSTILKFIQEIGVNLHNYRNILDIALINGRIEVVKYLVSQGFKIDNIGQETINVVINRNNDTIIRYVINETESIDIIKLLTTDKNFILNNLGYVVKIVLQRQCIDLIKRIVEFIVHSDKINIYNYRLNAARKSALKHNQNEIAEYLLDVLSANDQYIY